MDINKVQKLNNMALNLKKHNVVFSKEDAIKQAETIFGEEHNFSEENPNYNNGDFNVLRKDVRKLTFALQRSMEEIRNLKGKVNRLESELNDARVNQKTIPRQVRQPETLVVKEPEPVKESKPVQQKLPEEKKFTSPIDRNGIAPSDVSIDKFFYYGQN